MTNLMILIMSIAQCVVIINCESVKISNVDITWTNRGFC